MKTFFRAEGKHYTFRQLEFWAQDGYIKVRDLSVDPLEDHDLMCKEFLQHAAAINRSISHVDYADERSQFSNLVDDMIAAVKEAKKQGAIDDPRFIEWATKHRPFFNSTFFMGGGKKGPGSSAWTSGARIVDDKGKILDGPAFPSPQGPQEIILPEGD